jgi:hypothetical protein
MGQDTVVQYVEGQNWMIRTLSSGSAPSVMEIMNIVRIIFLRMSM